MSEPVSSTRRRILLISDIHYASDLERARGDYETRTVSQPLLRYFLKMYRRLIRRRDPFAMNGLLDTFIDAESSADLCLGVGDYSCDSAFIGVADYAASLRARTVVIGGLNPDYPGDQWHHGLSQLVMTCRAYGLRAIDGPFGDFKDPEAYIASAKRAAAIGIEGKWAIHPSQIDLANKVFSPPETEVNRAKKILEELVKAAKEGKGAAQLDGRMIDAASARMAKNIVNINKLIESK